MANRFPLVNSGYDPEIVNATLAQMEEIIRSYKEKDTAIKNAILNAQIAADNIVKNAQEEADELRHISDKQVETLLGSIEAHREVVHAFKKTYNQMIKRYLVEINEENFKDLEAQLDDMAISAKSLGGLGQGAEQGAVRIKETPEFISRQDQYSADKTSYPAAAESPLTNEENIHDKLSRLRAENERKLSESLSLDAIKKEIDDSGIHQQEEDDDLGAYTQRPLSPAEILGLHTDTDN